MSPRNASLTCMRAQVLGLAPWGGVALLGALWMVQVSGTGEPLRTHLSRPSLLLWQPFGWIKEQLVGGEAEKK